MLEFENIDIEAVEKVKKVLDDAGIKHSSLFWDENKQSKKPSTYAVYRVDGEIDRIPSNDTSEVDETEIVLSVFTTSQFFRSLRKALKSKLISEGFSISQGFEEKEKDTKYYRFDLELKIYKEG